LLSRLGEGSVASAFACVPATLAFGSRAILRGRLVCAFSEVAVVSLVPVMGGTPVRSRNHSLLPPPKALPVVLVRAAADQLSRDSLTAPMLGVHNKSNGIWLIAVQFVESLMTAMET
jgi:hypothetical protein